MQEGSIPRAVLDGVPEGVAKIERGAHSRLLLVGLDDFRLVLAGSLYGIPRRHRISSDQLVHVLLLPREERRVTYQPVLDHLAETALQLPIGQRVQGVCVNEHALGLVKGPNHVLPQRMVDSSLPPDGGVHHCHDCRRDLSADQANS